ncbi:hypothetical protein HGRIS_003623 [Hohenbuehelia grisea]|uniref:Uncharacterized protein n=1 Tax=Hohenbuehelia grisea TaxID=104357 RepID=A0ABR3JGX9_9AGAR
MIPTENAPPEPEFFREASLKIVGLLTRPVPTPTYTPGRRGVCEAAYASRTTPMGYAVPFYDLASFKFWFYLIAAIGVLLAMALGFTLVLSKSHKPPLDDHLDTAGDDDGGEEGDSGVGSVAKASVFELFPSRYLPPTWLVILLVLSFKASLHQTGFDWASAFLVATSSCASIFVIEPLTVVALFIVEPEALSPSSSCLDVLSMFGPVFHEVRSMTCVLLCFVGKWAASCPWPLENEEDDVPRRDESVHFMLRDLHEAIAIFAWQARLIRAAFCTVIGLAVRHALSFVGPAIEVDDIDEWRAFVKQWTAAYKNVKWPRRIKLFSEGYLTCRRWLKVSTTSKVYITEQPLDADKILKETRLYLVHVCECVASITDRRSGEHIRDVVIDQAMILGDRLRVWYDEEHVGNGSFLEEA